MNDDRVLQDQLAQLRLGYAHRLPLRIQELSKTLDQTTGAESGGGLGELRRLAHKLAGSAAIYGFPDVTRLAREIEAWASVYLDSGDVPDFAAWRPVRDWLSELDALAIRAASSELPEPVPGSRPRPIDEVEKSASLVLIAEDTDTIDSLTRELGHFGFRVIAIGHPAALPQACRDHQPAAIVLDAEFGETWDAGLDIVKYLRGKGALQAPVIALSPRRDMRARLAAIRSGADAYILKPVNASTVIDTLERLRQPDDQEPYRIMIVDDDVSVARYVEAVLRGAGMITAIVTDPLEVAESMEAFSPELVLLDLYMPGCSGYEMAAVIRQQESFAGVSVVFMSGEEDVSKHVAALQEGGDDFLVKPIAAKRLVAIVRARVQRFRLLRALMVRDAMTGLLNYTAFRETLEHDFSRIRREDGALSLAVVNIDGFKPLNEKHGTGVGDDVLRSLSHLMKQRMRRSDVIGRLRGDEFGIVLPETSGGDAAYVLEQVRAAFEEIRHVSENGEFGATFSGGVADAMGRESASELCDAAELAMRTAKTAGRNRIILAADPPRAAPGRR